jgi:hypothetical protein
MKIVINHATRMEAPRVCVAGIDPSTLEHIRPTRPPSDPITRKLLREEGGPFGMGALVDIGTITPDPSPPETEDCLFKIDQARFDKNLSGEDFLELLAKMRAVDLSSAFGPELERVSRTYAVEAGNGGGSLAVLRAENRPVLEINRYGQLRLWYNDAEPSAYLSVKDVRFFEADHKTIRTSAVDDVNRRLRRGVDVFLMLGLTHPWSKPGETHDRHWLQLNGLCLADRAVGDVP